MSIGTILALLSIQEQNPTVSRFIQIIDALAELPLRVFAAHPRLRNTILHKMIEFRAHPSADVHVLESLESLRVVLLQSVNEPEWVHDEADEQFREAVQNNDFIFNESETIVFEAENMDRSDDSESQYDPEIDGRLYE